MEKIIEQKNTNNTAYHHSKTIATVNNTNALATSSKYGINKYAKFRALKLNNKIKIFNFLTIPEKIEFIFPNNKYFNYLFAQYTRKSIILFQKIIKKNPYEFMIPFKKTFQYYFENSNFAYSEIFSAIFLYIKHLNETKELIILDFPFFDNEDDFATSKKPIRRFNLRNIESLELHFDEKFDLFHEEKIHREFSYEDINDILVDQVDYNKTIFNITDNELVDRYLSRKPYRINLKYFSKHEFESSYFKSFKVEHFKFPQIEINFEELALEDGSNELLISYLGKFPNKIKKLSQAFNVITDLEMYLDKCPDMIIPTDEQEIDEIFLKYLNFDKILKANLKSLEKLEIIFYNNDHNNSESLRIHLKFILPILKKFSGPLEEYKFKIIYAFAIGLKPTENYTTRYITKTQLNNFEINDLIAFILDLNLTSLKENFYQPNKGFFEANHALLYVNKNINIGIETYLKIISACINKKAIKLSFVYERETINDLLRILNCIESDILQCLDLKVTCSKNNIEEIFSTLGLFFIKNTNIRKIHLYIVKGFIISLTTQNYDRHNSCLRRSLQYIKYFNLNYDLLFNEILDYLKFIDEDILDNLVQINFSGSLGIFNKNCPESKKKYNLKRLENIIITRLTTLNFLEQLACLNTPNLKSIYFEDPHKKCFSKNYELDKHCDLENNYVGYLNSLKSFKWMLVNTKYQDVGSEAMHCEVFDNKIINFDVLKIDLEETYLKRLKKLISNH